jgi:hypothetical protein
MGLLARSGSVQLSIPPPMALQSGLMPDPREEVRHMIQSSEASSQSILCNQPRKSMPWGPPHWAAAAPHPPTDPTASPTNTPLIRHLPSHLLHIS